MFSQNLHSGQGSEFNPFDLAPSASRGNTARRKSATSASPSMTGAAKSAKTSQSRHRAATTVDGTGRTRLFGATDLSNQGQPGRAPGATEPPSAITRLGGQS